MTDKEDKLDAIKAVEEFLEAAEIDRSYKVKLRRSFVVSIRGVLFLTYGAEGTSDEIPETIQGEEAEVSLLRRLHEAVRVADRAQEEIEVDLQLRDMDGINGWLESTLDIFRSDPDVVGRLMRNMSIEDIEAQRSWQRENNPEGFGPVLRTMKYVNQAFMNAGAPARPGYTKYFEQPKHDS